MALKGLDIFKLSPKKNCKECGSPTCMAFCMKVAQGAVSIDKCPYFSDEAKATLNEQTAPPMKTITVGEHKLGGETVLYRHEKTLVNKNMFAVSLCTCMSDAEVDAKLAEVAKVDYERIGERMYVEFLFLRNNGTESLRLEKSVDIPTAAKTRALLPAGVLGKAYLSDKDTTAPAVRPCAAKRVPRLWATTRRSASAFLLPAPSTRPTPH